MAFVDTTKLIDMGGQILLCNRIFTNITAPEQVGYNSPLGAGVGTELLPGGGTTPVPGGLAGQVQYNNGGMFGGLTNTQLTANINVFTSSFSGAVPSPGSSMTNFLRSDGTWVVPPGATSFSGLSGQATLSQLPSIAAGTVLGNPLGGSLGTPIALTRAQLTAVCNVFTFVLPGDVPASGGGTTNFLRADGTWAAPSGGGGGTPGGSSGQVQYNNSGAFGGLTNTQLTADINIFTSSLSGAVPGSGGSVNNFIRADGVWASPVGGTNGQVQYNNGGTFGGLTNTQLTADINIFTSSLSGAVPGSGGGTTNFLRADGTWAAPAGGGGGLWPPVQRSVTSTPTIVGTDVILNCNFSSPTTISLPQASTRSGKPITVFGINAGSNSITITPFSGDTFVNWTSPTSIILNANGQVVTINPFNDGVNTGWFIA